MFDLAWLAFCFSDYLLEEVAFERGKILIG
jgi:hypothetical protein